MMKNKSSTFISGVLAFGIYFVLVITLLFYFNMRDEKKPIHYVKKNEDRIRVSLSSPSPLPKKETKKVVKPKPKKKAAAPKPKKKVEKVVKKKVVKKKVIKEKVVKKVKPPKKKKETKTTTKKVNKPKDLFANVSANKKPEKKKVKKQKITKPKVSASKLFNDSMKVQKTSDRGIENAYLARVEEKLNGWPAQSEYAGEKAKVWFKIETTGSFKFKVITRSSNHDFNVGLEEYLKQLQRFGFGPHKGGRAYEINVEFIATE